MTVTVNSVGAVQTFDQPDVTFAYSNDGGLTIQSDGNTVALFAEWDSVSTDAFDAANTVIAPVATAPVIAAPNAAPPEPTPHVEATEVPVEALPDADVSTEPPEVTPTSLSQPGGPVLPPA